MAAPAPPPTAGQLYDQEIRRLFNEMFPNHRFAVLPRAELLPDAVASASVTRQTGSSTFLMSTVTTAETSGDYKKEDVPNQLKKLKPDFTKHATINLYTRRDIVFTITPFTDMAVCIPSDDDMLRKKLSDSANVLQRYVGGYIAAILELLLQDYFDSSKANLDYSTESNIMNFDWKVKDTTFATFFKSVAEQLVQDLHSGVPAGFTDSVGTLYAASESQYKLDGTFVDFALLLSNPERVFTTKTTGTLGETAGTFEQEYKLHNVYVEIKVKDATGHSVRNHAVRAIESIYRFDDGVSACFCLSHHADGTGASTATTTAFRLSRKFAAVYQTTANGKSNAVPVARSVSTIFRATGAQQATEVQLTLSGKKIVAYVGEAADEVKVTADTGLLVETDEY